MTSTRAPSSSTPMSLQQLDWRSQEYRRILILSLRDACKALTPFCHNDIKNNNNNNNQPLFLSMDLPEVEQLVTVLESILFHGIKIREFQNIIPLWGLLERLEVIQPPCISLRNTVGAVSCTTNLRTPFGKARGWIRQSLNAQNLDESIQFMIGQENWVTKFYYQEALLRVKNDADMLVRCCKKNKNKIPCFLTRR